MALNLTTGYGGGSNPFEKHGIRHLSPSSLNLYSAEPAAWAFRYLFKFKELMGPRVWLGKAVEDGLTWFVYRDDPEGALDTANDSYRLQEREWAEQNEGLVAEGSEEAQEHLSPMLDQAMAVFKPWGRPVATQFKIQHWFDGIEVPVIGYLDYVYEDFLVDLKTTLRCPSEPRPDHCRQVLIYKAGTKKKPILAYVTPKKSAVYDMIEDSHLQAAERAAHSIRALLSMAPDAKQAARVFAPDFSSFWWSKAAIKAAAPIWAID